MTTVPPSATTFALKRALDIRAPLGASSWHRQVNEKGSRQSGLQLGLTSRRQRLKHRPKP